MNSFVLSKFKLALVLASLPWPSVAENATLVLPFGAEPGAPLTHAYDYGAPPVPEGHYTMRVPSVDATIAPIFPDLEITIAAPSKTVVRTHAERAYSALAECSAAAKTVQAKLQAALPSPYAGSNPAWQFQSADGRVVGGVNCRVERYLPYPILIFDLTTAQ